MRRNMPRHLWPSRLRDQPQFAEASATPHRRHPQVDGAVSKGPFAPNRRRSLTVRQHEIGSSASSSTGAYSVPAFGNIRIRATYRRHVGLLNTWRRSDQVHVGYKDFIQFKAERFDPQRGRRCSRRPARGVVPVAKHRRLSCDCSLTDWARRRWGPATSRRLARP
jgi:hypothetical protein